MTPRLRTPQAPAADEARWTANLTLRRLTTAASRGSSSVHLIDLSDTRPTNQTLCGLEGAAPCPSNDIWVKACHDCIDAALAEGFTVARDGNALINLQRVPSTWS